MVRNKQRGFTIVELIVVIVVIAVLASISVVVYGGIQDRAHESVARANLDTNWKNLNALYLENGSYPKYMDTLKCGESLKPGEMNNDTYCPILSDDAFSAIYYDNNVNNGSQFELTIGRGEYGYSINDKGDYRKDKCTHKDESGTAETPSVYKCPGPGGREYSQ